MWGPSISERIHRQLCRPERKSLIGGLFGIEALSKPEYSERRGSPVTEELEGQRKSINPRAGLDGSRRKPGAILNLILTASLNLEESKAVSRYSSSIDLFIDFLRYGCNQTA